MPNAVQFAETVPGPTIEAVAKRARRYGCYVVCPILTLRQGVVNNSAVIVGRSGEIVGIYDKRRPVTSCADYSILEGGVAPGVGDGIFDLDFGRIGIRICFDAVFPEDWKMMAEAGVRLVLWPSAYDGGATLTSYAQLHQYWVVTSVHEKRSRIIDPCGITLLQTDSQVGMIVRDINLDFAVCHYDFNWSIPEHVLADYPGRVDVRSHYDGMFFVIEPTDPSLKVAEIRAKHGIETANQYSQRHREAYDMLQRGQVASPQAAAHGERPMHSKWPRVVVKTEEFKG
jgi:hypothetical protein